MQRRHRKFKKISKRKQSIQRKNHSENRESGLNKQHLRHNKRFRCGHDCKMRSMSRNTHRDYTRSPDENHKKDKNKMKKSNSSYPDA
jgi:hypothetical protein